jgi:hypothetical protein
VPALCTRDAAKGGARHRIPLTRANAWHSRINDIAAADGSAFFVGDEGTDGQGVLVGRYMVGHWQLTADNGQPAGTVDASLLSVSSLSRNGARAVGQGYTQDTFAPIPSYSTGTAGGGGRCRSREAAD